MADTFDAYIDNILLEMETLEDSWENAVARYEYPYVQGADLENMGLKTHVIRVRCYFFDNTTQETYDDHKKLLDLLKSQERHEFQHPVYGILKGEIESISARHDDRIRAAEIDVTFIEQMKTPDAIAYADIEAASDEAFIEGQDEQMEVFSEEAAATLGTESQGILSKALDPEQGILAQFENVSQTARNYIKQVDTFVTGLEATLTTVANPANGIISAIDYGVNLPGRVIGAVARCAERYVVLYESLKSAPARFLESFRLGMLELETTLGPTFGHHVRIAAGQRAALESAYLFKADEQERAKLKRTEQTKSFDAQGNYRNPDAAAPVMTVRDLENSLATVRGLLQDGIDQSRGMQTLKTQARLLLEHVNTVKLEREKIITVSLDNATPLHMVCLMYGLPYNYAERIYALNRIKNPNFTDGGIQIYAR